MNPIGPRQRPLSDARHAGGGNGERKTQFSGRGRVGILNHGTPYHLSIGLAKMHYTNGGIHENRTFSICLPSEDRMVETKNTGLWNPLRGIAGMRARL
jgi:hypothetical protein